MSHRDGVAASIAKELLAAEERSLELARAGTPLPSLLDFLVNTAESLSDGSFVASILLVDESGKHLVHGAAPSLPAAYNEAIDGISIGPKVGSCGTAAHFGHAIYVTDIQRDPLWEDFRELAASHELRACWSTPFFAGNGKLLGTFALYYREPRSPTENDREVIKTICEVTAAVVEASRAG